MVKDRPIWQTLSPIAMQPSQPQSVESPSPTEEAASAMIAQPDTTRTSGTLPREIGGRPGPDPTRFGDWEKNGRCIDF